MMEFFRMEIDHHQTIISNPQFVDHVRFLVNELWQPPYDFDHLEVQNGYFNDRDKSIISVFGNPINGQSIIFDQFTINRRINGSNVMISYKGIEEKEYMVSFIDAIRSFIL